MKQYIHVFIKCLKTNKKVFIISKNVIKGQKYLELRSEFMQNGALSR